MTAGRRPFGHVMFIVSGLERGGAESQLVSLANGLAGRGWRVTVVSYLPFSEASLRSALHEPDVRAVTLGAARGVLKYAGLVRAARVVRRVRPDLLVGFMFHGMMTSRLLGQFGGETVGISAIRNERDHPARERLLGLTHRLADAVTVLSRHMADDLRRRGVIGPSRTHVIPNAVDAAGFEAAQSRDRTRRDLGVADGRFVWLAAGRLHPQKDYPNLLRAFAKVARRRPEASLMIAGAGPLEDQVRSLTRQLGLSERVSMLGLRTDLPDLFSAADGLVLSSAWEGMPVVVLEAMAARRPVAATAVGAVPELIADGETGTLAPPGDHRALADGMVRLMELPPEARSAFVGRAYDRVRTEFSPEGVLDRWEALFARLLTR